MDEVIDILGEVNEANKAAKESEMFGQEGVYITIREGLSIRKRFHPCNIHTLSEKEVLDMAYELAHTILKIKERKQDKDAKEETNL